MSKTKQVHYPLQGNVGNSDHDINTRQNLPPAVPNTPKKGRQQKPTLQQQNAIADSQILAQAMENGESDFYVEMDV